jgi:hypothetical protein
VGLPGRVYQTGQSSWERHLDEADPKIFERAGGAKVYGVKTGVGIPIDVNTTIGRMVVALYSKDDIEVNEQILTQLSNDLLRFCPNPKWKLVVEMDSNADKQMNASDQPEIHQYHQGTSPVFEPRSNPFSSSTSRTSSVDIIHYHHGENQPVPPSVSNTSLNAQPPMVARPTLQHKFDIAQYDPAGSSPQVGPGGHPVSTKPASSERVRSGSTSSSCPSDSAPSPLDSASREEETRIAALLGDYMPGAEVPSTGEPTGSAGPPHSMALAHFMSLRLLLLRLPERRTEEENALLDIVKRSYQGFSRDGNRSNKEIASLLVKDWHFLTSTMSDGPSKSSPRLAGTFESGAASSTSSASFGTYQSYMLSAPTMTTHSAHGVPISMPPLRLAHTEVSTAGEEGMFKKRRISGDD